MTISQRRRDDLAVRPDLVFLTIGLLGAALGAVVLVTLAKKDFWEIIGTSVTSIAFAALTIVFLNFLWGTLGGEPLQQALMRLRASVELLNDSHESGLRRIYSKAAGFGSQDDWAGELRSAQRQVDLMGYTLQSWWRGAQFSDSASTLLRNGVQIRVLMMHENNPLFGKSERPDLSRGFQESLQVDLRGSLDAFGRLAEATATASLPGSIEVRLVIEGSIKWHLCRVDDSMICIPYMHSRLGAACPLFVVDRTPQGIFSTIQSEFEELWKDAEPHVSSGTTQPRTAP